MSAATLEAAMADMEAARAAFESSTSRVGDELERLQERVNAANKDASGERVHIADTERKRRRRSGGAGGAAAEGDNPDAAAEGAFRDAMDDADERLQAARRAMARAHATTQAVRAAVDSAKSSATELLSADRGFKPLYNEVLCHMHDHLNHKPCLQQLIAQRCANSCLRA